MKQHDKYLSEFFWIFELWLSLWPWSPDLIIPNFDLWRRVCKYVNTVSFNLFCIKTIFLKLFSSYHFFIQHFLSQRELFYPFLETTRVFIPLLVSSNRKSSHWLFVNLSIFRFLSKLSFLYLYICSGSQLLDSMRFF